MTDAWTADARGVEATAAAEARHGGRLITHYIAYDMRERQDFPYGREQARKALAGEYGEEVLRNVWRNSLSPSTLGGDRTPREQTQVVARSYADNGGEDVSYRRFNVMALANAEAMIEWPIYQAAYLGQVYVNVSGGVAEATVTRGEVEVILHDWDNFDQEDPGIDVRREARAALERVASPKYRALLLNDMDEIDDRFGDCETGGKHEPEWNEHGDAWCSKCGERLLLPGSAGARLP